MTPYAFGQYNEADVSPTTESEYCMMKKPSKFSWLLPAAFALPFAAAGIAALALYGSDLIDLMMVVLKMVVIA